MNGIRASLPCLLAIALLTSSAAAQVDPVVDDMTQAVSMTNLTSHVQSLQDFQTRHTYTDGNTEAGNWLFAYFANLGLEVERHEFSYSGHVEDNIIARIIGRTSPDEIVVISGHFDSTSNDPYVFAPGADDDASSIAAVLEAARIFRDYEFDRTVEFMCFNAEEQGRQGSIAIASDYLAAGKNIVAVVNADMIGYWPTGWGRTLDVAYEPVSEWLADHVISACQRYVGIPIAKHLSAACRDDHYSFTTQGISAITNMDCWEAHNGGGESTPHYHRTTDTIETLNLPCMTQAVQVSIASLAELAGPRVPAAVDGPNALRNLSATRILGVYPNPFYPSTEVLFTGLTNGAPMTLEIIDPQGRLVRTLVAGASNDGIGSVVWDGRDGLGRLVASGVYYSRLRGALSHRAQAMILAR